MSGYDFSSSERPVTKYVPDLELAYIMQRYKEVHDFVHTLLGYGITVTDELAVKWYELAQTGLPSTALASFFGPLNLLLIQHKPGELKKLFADYLPHIMENAHRSKFFMNVYFEHHFERDISDVRKDLGIRPLSTYL